MTHQWMDTNTKNAHELGIPIQTNDSTITIQCLNDENKFGISNQSWHAS